MKRTIRLVSSLGAFALALSACTSSSTPSAPNVNQQPNSNTVSYTSAASIGIPTLSKSLGNPPGTLPTSGGFDISWIGDGNYYLADRDSNGIDVINISSRKFVMTAGQGSFAGVNTTNGNAAGPNGIFNVGPNLVMAGDGNSTIKVVNTSTGSVVYSSPVITNMTSQAGKPVGWTCTQGPYLRADEGAWDSTDGIAIMVNDADCPPFATFYNTNSSSYPILGQLSFVGANGGAEQATWDPATDLFYISFPGTVANPNGELDVINPKTMSIVAAYPEPANCQGNGTALGPNEELFIGCSNAASGNLVIMNPTNGSTVAVVPGAAGCDEVYYNKGDNRFYAACSNNKTGNLGPIVAVVNAAAPFNLIATIPTNAGSHSIASDSGTNTTWVPLTGTTGVSVYTHN